MKTRQSHPLSSNLLKIAIQQRAYITAVRYFFRSSFTQRRKYLWVNVIVSHTISVQECTQKDTDKQNYLFQNDNIIRIIDVSYSKVY